MPTKVSTNVFMIFMRHNAVLTDECNPHKFLHVDFLAELRRLTISFPTSTYVFPHGLLQFTGPER